MIEVELKSKELKEYVYLELEKSKRDPLYDEDIDRIEDLTLNALDFLDEPTDITLFDLVFFNNLKSCTIIDKKISAQELNALNSVKSLETLQLVRCEIPNEVYLTSNINYVIIEKSTSVNMETFSRLKSLEKFRAINCVNFNLSGISKCENVTNVYLQNLNLNEIKELKEMKKLRKINLNGTKVKHMCKFSKNIEVIHEDENFILDEED